jgi:hypothetical protein
MIAGIVAAMGCFDRGGLAPARLGPFADLVVIGRDLGFARLVRRH